MFVIGKLLDAHRVLFLEEKLLKVSRESGCCSSLAFGLKEKITMELYWLNGMKKSCQ